MDESSNKSDAEVVQLVLSNKDFFAILVERYEAKLSRYLRRLGVSTAEDIEDLLQTVFIKVYKNLNSYSGEFTFSAWIYRICHNEAVSFFRAKRIRPHGNLIANSEEVLPYIFDDTEVPFETDKQYNKDEIGQALEKLDSKYRQIIILRYFEELSYEEISEFLKIPPGSVATHLYRAKKKLHALLAHLQ